MPKDRDDYEVGFGKPPKHSQFKKGVSGNPNGRPKGSKSFATTFNELAGEKMWVNTPNGRRRRSFFEVGLMQLLNQCAKGDPRAIREVIKLKSAFGDVLPPQAPPVFQVNFIKPRPWNAEAPRIEPPRTNTADPDTDDEDDYEPVESD